MSASRWSRREQEQEKDMATQNRKSVNGANGHRALAFDPAVIRSRAEQVTESASDIARIADEVSAGADSQIRSLDDALSNVNQMAASLRETAGQAESVTRSSETLPSPL